MKTIAALLLTMAVMWTGNPAVASQDAPETSRIVFYVA
jgi:hypothetical protein